MPERQPLPTPLRRPVHDPVVTEDSLHHACILVGVLAGRYSRHQACQAIGCTNTQLQEQIAVASQAGAMIVEAAIDGKFAWQGLWAYHIQQSEARPRPVVLSSPSDATQEETSP